ncbi:MAG: Zn-dependent alcohol dehydrogenase [Actinobacteria bacterium]|nr:Zn-dependent alcohol dehydrogenase [Actinomycetota bacterium]
MKAAVCREFGAPLVIEELHLADPGPGEVKVRMVATAICHSDITYAEGGWGGQLPAVYGHEGAGVVAEVGPGVHSVKVGDAVVVTLIRSCGHCHGCTMGMPVTCDATFPLDATSPLTDASGASIVHGLRTAAFAEQVVVEESQLVVVPADLGFDVASLLACGVITGFGAVTNTAGVQPGSHVVVFGCGGVGLNSVQGALLSGAQTIVAIDLAESKLQAALEFGATHTLNPVTDDVVARVRELTDGRGADYVFVTVGAKAAFDASYALLAKAGAVVLVGMPANGVMSEIDPGTMAAYSQRILGSKMGGSRISIDIPNLVNLYKQGRLKLDELISGRYALADINEAMESVKRGDALRNVIVF